MEAKNLMVGNYVKDPYNHIIRLVSVEKDQSMVRPIPITEEWLNDFGFRKYAGNHYIELSGGSMHAKFYVQRPVKSKSDYYFYWDEFGRIELKSVNQLQNLFFALTGNQLEVKQKVSV